MLSTQMGLVQAYEVLEASESMTRAEIKKTYRALMLKYHPDVTGGDPDLAEKAKLVAHAWEVVLLCHRDPELQAERLTEESTTETEVEVGGFFCKLITINRPGGWFSESVLKLPLAYCENNPSTLRNFSLIDADGRRFWSLAIDVIDDRNTVVFSSPYSHGLQLAYERYRRTQRALKLQSHIAVQQRRLDDLPASKKPSEHRVFDLISEFESQVYWYIDGWKAEKYLQKAQELLRQIEHEIDALETSDPVAIAIEQLMSGTSHSMSHSRNLEVVAQINSAAVRTGSFIEVFGEEEMREFYRKVLEGFDNPLAHLYDKALLLDIEDYAPAELLDDPDLETAPLQIAFESNKGEALYDVTYRFVNETPIAVVRLPFKVYQRHAPEYGKPSRFPELPHGIVWAAEVEFDGRVIARGQVDDDLNRKVEKWERGKNRSKHREESITMGDLLFGAETSGVPPWYQGKARPGRRK